MTRSFAIPIAALAALFMTAPIFAADDKPTPPDQSPTAQRSADQRPERKRTPEDRAALFDKLDANHDGVITSDEVPEEQRRLFDRLVRRADKNKDGKLSREEFMAGFEDRGGPAASGEGRPDAGANAGPESRPMGGMIMGFAIFRALDKNGDGKLDSSEIAAATEVLKKLDKNGDGELTREELMQSLPEGFAAGLAQGSGLPQLSPEAAMKRMLQQWDKNGDGKLQKDELPPRLQERFEELDANKDGVLDESELKQIMPQLVRRFQEGAKGGIPGAKGKKSDSKSE